MIDLRKIEKEIYLEYYPKNKKYTFYYDETNNYRRIKINKYGLNNNNALFYNFILGGICFDKKVYINDLFKNLRISKYQELKSKQLFIGKNKFEECINNKNLYIILDWIMKNGYFHFVDVDSLYFCIIDIIDSLVQNYSNNIPKDFSTIMKDELYFLVRNNFDIFLQICSAVKFPNMNENSIAIFCEDMISFIDKTSINSEKELYSVEFIKELFKMAKNSKRLIYLKQLPNDTLFDTYYEIYQQRCIVFKDSIHIFDNEFVYEEKMSKNKVLDGSMELNNYEFKDSKKVLEIQISDCIVFLISKFYYFLMFNSKEYIDYLIKNMCNIQVENLKLLIRLINKSNLENPFFIETINSNRAIIYRNTMIEHIKFMLGIFN